MYTSITIIYQEKLASGGNLVNTFICYWYKFMDFLVLCHMPIKTMGNGYACVMSAAHFGYINTIMICSKKPHIYTFIYQHFVVYNGCYTQVKPRIIMKKDFKDIKGISKNTHTHAYINIYIYIYIYI